MKSAFLLGILGFVILSGFIGDLIFRKWKIPSVVFLIFIGAFVNNAFGLIDIKDVFSVAPHIGALAFAIILFEGGLHIDIYEIVRKSLPAFFFSTVSFLITSLSTMFIMFYLLGNLKVAVLAGIMVGCTSGPIVIPIMNRIRGISEDAKTIASFDSVLSDIYAVVGFTIALEIMESGMVNPAPKIFASFFNAFFVAIVGGFLWLKFAEVFIGGEISYMLTLGYLLGIYWITELMGGSGPLASLILGLVIANSKEVFERITKRIKGLEDNIDLSKIDFLERTTDEYTRRMSIELSFLFRTVFFLMLGLALDVSYILKKEVILIILLVFTVICISRVVAVLMLGFVDRDLSRKDKLVIFSMMPRGLITAIASFFAGNFFPQYAEKLISLSLGVILLSILVMSILISRISPEGSSYDERISTGENSSNE